MKKSILNIAAVAAIVLVSFTSCDKKAAASTETSADSTAVDTLATADTVAADTVKADTVAAPVADTAKAK